ncbi:DASH family cryptochrome [Pseudomonadales bacterium]|jgi:deoxyribodipyrimidine photo-lyase|nr:DASH family cryptochrome [Pseudomonadales bacterium]
MHRVGLFWFNHDLRIDDNIALNFAAAQVDQLLCLYCLPPSSKGIDSTEPSALSRHRLQFLLESLQDLDRSLKSYQQHLLVTYDSGVSAIAQLITQHNITQVFCSTPTGYYEQQQWQVLAQRYRMIGFHAIDNNRLFSLEQLPFELSDLPSSFSKFRRAVESITVPSPALRLASLPPSPASPQTWLAHFPSFEKNKTALFKGGEQSGAAHVSRYFEQELASTYKQTRNGLDGMDYSTKFSPWLANGGLSPRRAIHELRRYEQRVESNDSTYWIYFELLWREYFHRYAQKYGGRLFSFAGISGQRPITSFYPQRFKKWCCGTTPYPIINACMRQLNSTGYLSNRGRQWVASCLVHELAIDWRYGAAYLEQQLVDYDVACNWGNWQYLAGVGADPRGHRRFNLEKQAKTYDLDGAFTARWQGDFSDATLDHVDAADWPIG